MRSTEKFLVVMILSLVTWAVIMLVTTGLQFEGSQSNRLLLVQLGSDANSLTRAVQANDTRDTEGATHNRGVVVRNTYMDYLFILLYLITFLGLSYLAGILGRRLFAALAAVSIAIAAVCDVFENGAILAAMHVTPFTDQVAVDITQFSQLKWAFFFLAVLFLGLAIALNRRISQLRRVSGGIFVAAGAFGILGIARHRVSVDFAIWMIDLGILLVAAALLLTLWKLYLSLKELREVEHAPDARVHA